MATSKAVAKKGGMMPRRRSAEISGDPRFSEALLLFEQCGDCQKCLHQTECWQFFSTYVSERNNFKNKDYLDVVKNRLAGFTKNRRLLEQFRESLKEVKSA